MVDAAIELFENDCPNACAVLELLPTALLLIGNMVGLLDVAGELQNKSGPLACLAPYILQNICCGSTGLAEVLCAPACCLRLSSLQAFEVDGHAHARFLAVSRV